MLVDERESFTKEHHNVLVIFTHSCDSILWNLYFTSFAFGRKASHAFNIVVEVPVDAARSRSIDTYIYENNGRTLFSILCQRIHCVHLDLFVVDQIDGHDVAEAECRQRRELFVVQVDAHYVPALEIDEGRN